MDILGAHFASGLNRKRTEGLPAGTALYLSTGARPRGHGPQKQHRFAGGKISKVKEDLRAMGLNVVDTAGEATLLVLPRGTKKVGSKMKSRYPQFADPENVLSEDELMDMLPKPASMVPAPNPLMYGPDPSFNGTSTLPFPKLAGAYSGEIKYDQDTRNVYVPDVLRPGPVSAKFWKPEYVAKIQSVRNLEPSDELLQLYTKYWQDVFRRGKPRPPLQRREQDVVQSVARPPVRSLPVESNRTRPTVQEYVAKSQYDAKSQNESRLHQQELEVKELLDQMVVDQGLKVRQQIQNQPLNPETMFGTQSGIPPEQTRQIQEHMERLAQEQQSLQPQTEQQSRPLGPTLQLNTQDNPILLYLKQMIDRIRFMQQEYWQYKSSWSITEKNKEDIQWKWDWNFMKQHQKLVNIPVLYNYNVSLIQLTRALMRFRRVLMTNLDLPPEMDISKCSGGEMQASNMVAKIPNQYDWEQFLRKSEVQMKREAPGLNVILSLAIKACETELKNSATLYGQQTKNMKQALKESNLTLNCEKNENLTCIKTQKQNSNEFESVIGMFMLTDTLQGVSCEIFSDLEKHSGDKIFTLGCTPSALPHIFIDFQQFHKFFLVNAFPSQAGPPELTETITPPDFCCFMAKDLRLCYHTMTVIDELQDQASTTKSPAPYVAFPRYEKRNPEHWEEVNTLQVWNLRQTLAYLRNYKVAKLVLQIYLYQQDPTTVKEHKVQVDIGSLYALMMEVLHKQKLQPLEIQKLHLCAFMVCSVFMLGQICSMIDVNAIKKLRDSIEEEKDTKFVYYPDFEILPVENAQRNWGDTLRYAWHRLRGGTAVAVT